MAFRNALKQCIIVMILLLNSSGLAASSTEDPRLTQAEVAGVVLALADGITPLWENYLEIADKPQIKEFVGRTVKYYELSNVNLRSLFERNHIIPDKIKFEQYRLFFKQYHNLIEEDYLNWIKLHPIPDGISCKQDLMPLIFAIYLNPGLPAFIGEDFISAIENDEFREFLLQVALFLEANTKEAEQLKEDVCD
jgi:hypothetical protein